jgi:hypothetical protein
MKRTTEAERHVRKRIRPDLVDKAQKILSALEAADSLEDRPFPCSGFTR